MWYVIRVVTSKEKKILELIEKELKIYKLDKKYNEMLVPSKKTLQMRKGKKYTIEKNDFPGYILIETDYINELISTIKNVSNVLGFLGTDKPEPLKQKEIDRIIGRQDDVVEDKYFIGETINITDGPFSSFVGDIVVVDDKKKVVKVNVKVFGRDVPVNLTYLQIEKS